MKINIKQHRSLEIDNKGNGKDTEAISLSLSSETPVLRSFGNEILLHGPDNIDMSRAKNGLPLLVSHNDEKLPIGKIRNIRIDSVSKKLRGDAYFSSRPEAQAVKKDIQDEILGEASIGYKILDHKVERSNDKGIPNNVYITKWMPYECSIVAIPADNTVGVGRNDSEELEIELDINESTESREEDIIDMETRKDNNDKKDKPKSDVVLPPDEVAAKEDAESQSSEGQPNADTLDQPAEEAEALAEEKVLEAAEEVEEEAETPAEEAAEDESTVAEDTTVPDKTKKNKKSELLLDPKLMLLKEAIINKQEITYSKENRKMDNTMIYRSFMQALKGDLAKVDDSVKPLFEANGNRGFTADLFMTRADSYTTTSNGGTNTIYEQNIGFLDLLRARTAVLAAGGSTRTGVGSLSYIRQKQAVTAVLRGENSGPVTASNADFEKVPYTPKALVAKVLLTDELQKESILDLQSILKGDMIKQFALAIDNYSINGNTSPAINGLLSAGSGIYNGDLQTAALPTWGAVNHLKGLVDQLGVNLNSCAYITTPALMSVLETTPRFANGFGGPIADSNKVGSYPIFTSSHVPVSTADHTLIFGDFSNLEVCLMGPTEFSIDTVTRFDEGVTILTARQYFDIGIKQKLAFAKASNFLIQ